MSARHGTHAQVLSCIPMCLSSVYKEKALGDDDMDVIYLNGWVAVFGFMSSLVFAAPSAYAMGLPVSVSNIPTHRIYRYHHFVTTSLKSHHRPILGTTLHHSTACDDYRTHD